MTRRAALLLAGVLASPALAAEPARKAGPTLAQYYAARSFPGAPPGYAHRDEADYEAVPEACLSCHKRGTGGAPATPHPQLPECRHCHLFTRAKGTFRASTFAALPPPKRAGRAVPGGPPVMAHPPSALRGSCLACHGEKGQLEALRTPHPERTACEQCHVPQRTPLAWQPPPLDRALAEKAPSGGDPSAAQPGR